jgi:hypothetical protein
MNKMPVVSAIPPIEYGEPRVHMDVRLGEQFVLVDAEQRHYASHLTAMGLREDQAGKRDVFISADVGHTRPDSDYVKRGECIDGNNIMVYMGSFLKACGGQFSDDVLGKLGTMLYINRESSKVGAHELRHSADADVLGKTALREEWNQYIRPILWRRVRLPLGIVSLPGVAGIAATWFAPELGVSDWQRASIGVVGTALAVTGILWALKRTRSAYRDHTVYLERPNEQRARAYADAYEQQLDTLTAPLLLQVSFNLSPSRNNV